MRKNRLGMLIPFVVLALLPQACKQDQSPERPPNIILFFVDDLGYGDLGCYGQEIIRTPNLDRMAGEGVRFTRFYSASPVCAPSRCSLMTGKHAGRAHVRHNVNLSVPGQIPLPAEEVTMAELLKEAGYTTAAMGKWSLGAPGNSGDPLKQGFDHFFGYYCQCMAHNYYPAMVWRNGDSVALRNEVVPVQVSYTDYPLSYAVKKVDNSAVLALDEALAFMDEHREEPFFLYYASTLPHSNGEAPPDERFEVPHWGIYADSAWSPADKGYAAMVTLIDEQVGAMLARLEELDLEEQTLVVFTSDNGPTLFAERMLSAGDLRGRKRDLYEGGIRVPMIARWPGKIPGGLSTDQPAATYDLLATFCDLAGVAAPEEGSGLSLVPVMTGRDEAVHESLYWEIWEGEDSPKQAILAGDWKLIRFNFTDPDHSGLELYNLEQDPGESRNLATADSSRVKQLLLMMETEHQSYANAHYQKR